MKCNLHGRLRIIAFSIGLLCATTQASPKLCLNALVDSESALWLEVFRLLYAKSWDTYSASDQELIQVIHQYVKSAVRERDHNLAFPDKVRESTKNLLNKQKIDKVLIPDPELREYAQAIQSAFMDHELSQNFYASLYARIFTHASKKNAITYDPKNGIPLIDRSAAREELWKIAKELGFKEELNLVANNILPYHEFRQNFLKPDSVFWDSTPGAITTLHGRSSHYLQMLYARHILNERFGKEAYPDFFEYLGTPEGYRIWHILFDLGPPFHGNAAHVRFFTNSGIIYLLGLE